MSLSNKLAIPQALSAKDPWALARRRARTYLSLQALPEATCEQILQQALHYLPSKPPKAESEQIQAFLQSAQQATQILLGSSTYNAQLVNSAKTGRFVNWTARKTGPRVERSSIKVAPLQAISLRLKPVQAAASRH
ncbi:hypothetical protein [uncultured Thiothrix sp.]|uniref:hypothetical protein n=1 Tax=uncultured Thiothrix sp. TaxID=223185 RepID=UPI0026334A66|nr:hypothetical protein [uncultured Thiothrix sp.]HMT94579.1 hypothetical protein [Thiolinea sp.]